MLAWGSAIDACSTFPFRRPPQSFVALARRADAKAPANRSIRFYFSIHSFSKLIKNSHLCLCFHSFSLHSFSIVAVICYPATAMRAATGGPSGASNTILRRTRTRDLKQLVFNTSERRDKRAMPRGRLKRTRRYPL